MAGQKGKFMRRVLRSLRALVVPVVLLSTVVSTASIAQAQSRSHVAAPHSTVVPSLVQLHSDLISAQSLSTFPSSLMAELTNSLDHQSYSGGCTSAKTSPANVITTGCTFGQVASSKTVVLYGDSLASMWQPALDWLGTADHFKLVLVARLNCPFANIPKTAYKDAFCYQWKINAVAYINSLHPSVVIFSEKNVGSSVDLSSPSATPTVFASGVKTTLGLIHAPVKAVLLGMPYVHFDSNYADNPGPCIAIYSASLTKCDTPVAKAFVPTRLTDDTKAVHSVVNAKVVTVTNLVCGPVSCPVVAYDAGTPYIVFSNQFHITKWYAALIGSALRTDLVNSKVTGV